MNSKAFSKLMRSSFRGFNGSNRSLRQSQNQFKPSRVKEAEEEDIYEKICREEKEKISNRDKENAKQMGMKSLPVKILTYGCFLIGNYFIIKTVYDYVINLNNSADKTAQVQ